jgi:hypothetical protein
MCVVPPELEVVRPHHDVQLVARGRAIERDVEGPDACPDRARLGREHIGLADEARHELGGRVIHDLEGRSHLVDPPAVHHHHPIGQGEGLLLVVRHEQRRDPRLLVQLAEPAAQVAAHLRVEGGEGLVQ